MKTSTAPAGEASDWLAAANALAAILAAENDALRAVDFSAATGLLQAKRDAIALLETLPRGTAPPDAPALHRLDQLAAENRRLLNRSIAIQSQVLGIIAGAARSAAAFGYGNSGEAAIRGGAFRLSAKA